MTREEKITLGAGVAFFVGLIAWGASTGAFAGNKGTPGAEPLPPRPSPDTGRLPSPAPAHVEPVVTQETTSVPAELAEIAAGGVPIADGWATVAWYSYRGWWIRVDVRPDADSMPGHEHGQYRWTVVGGSTPLATWSTEGKGFGAIVSIEDANTDWVASNAAAWVDAVAG